MRPADQLATFVAEALKAGRSREEISAALTEAGWTGPEIRAALHAWADTGFVPPVPRPRPMRSPSATISGSRSTTRGDRVCRTQRATS